MILAAGLGTRLRPLTYETPKALVEIGGLPMIEHVARRVVEAGADRIVVNVAPLAEQILDYIGSRDSWGVDVRVSVEPEPLETGGGLLKAAEHFRRDRPILVHNADILTDLDLDALYDAHRDDALATLAVREADSDRYLTFDAVGMTGVAYGGGEHRAREPEDAEERRDYLGVQVVSPRLLDLFEEEGKFSIFTPYMRLIRNGERIAAFDAEGVRWTDIGTHEELARAREEWAAAQ